MINVHHRSTRLQSANRIDLQLRRFAERLRRGRQVVWLTAVTAFLEAPDTTAYAVREIVGEIRESLTDSVAITDDAGVIASAGNEPRRVVSFGAFAVSLAHGTTLRFSQDRHQLQIDRPHSLVRSDRGRPSKLDLAHGHRMAGAALVKSRYASAGFSWERGRPARHQETRWRRSQDDTAQINQN